MMEWINVEEINYIDNLESPSKRWMNFGKWVQRYFNAGLAVGAELNHIQTANNNWRKMHGQPMYHRNRPSMKRADQLKLMKWEDEHPEEVD